jgi:hypothetical protein
MDDIRAVLEALQLLDEPLPLKAVQIGQAFDARTAADDFDAAGADLDDLFQCPNARDGMREVVAAGCSSERPGCPAPGPRPGGSPAGFRRPCRATDWRRYWFFQRRLCRWLSARTTAPDGLGLRHCCKYIASPGNRSIDYFLLSSSCRRVRNMPTTTQNVFPSSRHRNKPFLIAKKKSACKSIFKVFSSVLRFCGLGLQSVLLLLLSKQFHSNPVVH